MDGRSMGRTSFVKRTAIREGTVAVGKKVKVAWEKAKKSYNAEILSVGSTTTAPVAHRGRTATEEEPFTSELPAAAPRLSTQPQPTPHADRRCGLGRPRWRSLRVEACLLCRLQVLEDKMTTLQREILEKCTLLPPSSLTMPALTPLLPPLSATLLAPGPATQPPPPSAASTPGLSPADHVRSNGEQENLPYPHWSPLLSETSLLRENVAGGHTGRLHCALLALPCLAANTEETWLRA